MYKYMLIGHTDKTTTSDHMRKPFSRFVSWFRGLALNDKRPHAVLFVQHANVPVPSQLLNSLLSLVQGKKGDKYGMLKQFI